MVFGQVQACADLINPFTFLLLRTFLQCQVVTGMEAEQIIESLTNYT